MHVHDVHDMGACVSCLGHWAGCFCSIRVLWICYFHEGQRKRCSWTKRRTIAFVPSQYPQKSKQPPRVFSVIHNEPKDTLLTFWLQSGSINLRTRVLGVLPGTPLLSQPRLHASSFVGRHHPYSESFHTSAASPGPRFASA